VSGEEQRAGGALLDPETLTRIGNLELVARRVVQGFLTGMHRSSLRGFSTEFDQFRPYAQGDDLKHVDWKIFARSDRFFVKEYEADRNLDTVLAVDGSGSMGFRGAGVEKFRYAGMLAATLGHLLLHQRDRVELLLAAGAEARSVPMGCRPGHLQRMVALLESARPSGTADVPSLLRSVVARRMRPGLVVVISDLYDWGEEWRNALALLRQAGHEALVFHLLDGQEREFPFRGPQEFVDLEAGGSLALDASAAREDYLRRLERFLQKVSRTCAVVSASYVELDPALPLAGPLAAFLAARSGGRRVAIPWH
jgi:uncharacterized protein (DUF58 family)